MALSRCQAILLASILCFSPPIIISDFYIDRLTIKEFSLAEGTTAVAVSSFLPLGSSTPPYSSIPGNKFLDFSKAARYLSLFNINPDLIGFDLYLTNKVRLVLAIKELDGDDAKNIELPSILVCDQSPLLYENNHLPFKSDLVLNDPKGSDWKLLERIYQDCVSNFNIAVQNTLNRTVRVVGVETKAGSGVEVIVIPQLFSRMIILFAFVTLWVGFLILMIEGPRKVYGLLRNLLRKENDYGSKCR